ncbi:MAG: 16S rRNA (cytosine(967)-C(5))-methyltransferase RsmB, partial [Lachnospiraceae bacterium]|nr:16S rRNA (cytosine(967)-C(5))-methyltransferase RsmB [Lachnospiraceae bacterium]
MTDLRSICLNGLMEIEAGKKDPSAVLSDIARKYAFLEKSERSFMVRLIKGTVEKRIMLDYVIDSYSKTPSAKMRPLIRTLLRMSVYQLYEMDNVPESAVCNEAVKLAKKNGFRQLSGFVNGVLRSISGGRDSLVFPDREKDREGYINICCSVPLYLTKMWIRELGAETALMMAEYSHRDTGLAANVNTLKTDRDSLIMSLASEGAEAVPGNYWDRAVIIRDVDRLTELSSFKNGEFFVQDESSMFVCENAGIRPGSSVLDLCAAPGGKTMHAATLTGRGGSVVSMDRDEKKLLKINENLERTGLSDIVKTEDNDASVLREDLIGGFDTVLCDVPCSGLGITGRKPDIKYNVTEETIESLVPLQRSILYNGAR